MADRSQLPTIPELPAIPDGNGPDAKYHRLTTALTAARLQLQLIQRHAGCGQLGATDLDARLNRVGASLTRATDEVRQLD
jgi:hypothetical protein